MTRVHDVVLLIGLALLSPAARLPGSPLSAAHAQAPAKGVRFVGSIHGAPAVAEVSFEPLPNFSLMAGQIQSGGFVYWFRAEIIGQSGFGEMLNASSNERFQIRIDATPTGFALTSNPFGPGQPSTYLFSAGRAGETPGPEDDPIDRLNR